MLRRFIFCASFILYCGATPPMLDGRIVGGHDISIEECPYQASLLYYGKHFCGGSIISEKHVLTAAHCTNGVNKDFISVRVGSSYLNAGGEVINVIDIYQNKHFNLNDMGFDVSVLVLKEPVQFKAGIQKIKLNEKQNNVVAPGTLGLVTGWGTTSSQGDLAKMLQGVEVAIISKKECQKDYNKINQVPSISDTMLCAGSSKKDSCQGDSGGPLVADGLLIGIVSWGYGCADPAFPGVYTDVSSISEGIKNLTGI